MADNIGVAFVRVVPEASGFQEALRKKLASQGRSASKSEALSKAMMPSSASIGRVAKVLGEAGAVGFRSGLRKGAATVGGENATAKAMFPSTTSVTTVAKNLGRAAGLAYRAGMKEGLAGKSLMNSLLPTVADGRSRGLQSIRAFHKAQSKEQKRIEKARSLSLPDDATAQQVKTAKSAAEARGKAAAQAMTSALTGARAAGPSLSAAAAAGAAGGKAYGDSFTSAAERAVDNTEHRTSRAGKRQVRYNPQNAFDSRTFGNALNSAGRSLTWSASGAAGLTLGMSAYLGASFESAISRAASAVPGALEEIDGKFPTHSKWMEAFAEEAKEVAGATIFNPNEAAKGLEALTKGGLQAKRALDSLATVVDLAVVGDIPLDNAATIAVTALNVFDAQRKSLKLSSKRFIQTVGDSIATAAISSNSDVAGIGLAFDKAAGKAASMGLSVEETTASIALLAKGGQRGPTGGIVLNQYLKSLTAGQDQTTKQGKAFKEYGFEVYDAAGKMRPMVEISKSLNDILTDAKTEKARNQIAQALFPNVRAARAATVMALFGKATKDGRTEYQKMLDLIKDGDGDLEKLEKLTLGKTARSFEEMKGSLEEAGIALGDAFAPSLVDATDALQGLAEGFSKMDEGKLSLIAKALGAIAVLGPALWITGAAIRSIATLSQAAKWAKARAAGGGDRLFGPTSGVADRSRESRDTKRNSKRIAKAHRELGVSTAATSRQITKLSAAQSAAARHQDNANRLTRTAARNASLAAEQQRRLGGVSIAANQRERAAARYRTRSARATQRAAKAQERANKANAKAGRVRAGAGGGKTPRKVPKIPKVGGAATAALIGVSTVVAVLAEHNANLEEGADRLAGTLRRIAGLPVANLPGADITPVSIEQLSVDFIGDFKLEDLKKTPFTLDEITSAVANGGAELDKLKVKFDEWSDFDGLGDSRGDAFGRGAFGDFFNDKDALGNAIDARIRELEEGRAQIAAIEAGAAAADRKKGKSSLNLVPLSESESAARVATHTAAIEKWEFAMKQANHTAQLRRQGLLKGEALTNAAKRSLHGLVNESRGVSEAQVASQASASDVAKTVRLQVAAFEKSAVAMGFNRAQAQAMAIEFGLIPKSVQTYIKLKGAAEAKTKIGNIDDEIEGLRADRDAVEFETINPEEKTKKVKELNDKIKALKSKKVKVTAKTKGFRKLLKQLGLVEGKKLESRTITVIAETSEANVPIEATQKALDDLEKDTYEPEVKLKGEAKKEAEDIKSAMDDLTDVDVFVTVKTNYEDAPGFIGPKEPEAEGWGGTGGVVGAGGAARGALSSAGAATALGSTRNASSITASSSGYGSGGIVRTIREASRAEVEALKQAYAARVRAIARGQSTTAAALIKGAKGFGEALNKLGAKQIETILKDYRKAGRKLGGEGKEAFDKAFAKIESKAQKRIDSLKATLDGGKAAISAGQGDYRFAHRGTGDDIQGIFQDVLDLATVEKLNKQQKQGVRQIANNSKAAFDQLGARLKQYEFAREMRDSMVESGQTSWFDWSKLVSGDKLLETLSRVTPHMQTFAADMKRLRAGGAPAKLIEQIAKMDPRQGAQLARSLALDPKKAKEVYGVYATFEKTVHSVADSVSAAAFAETGAQAAQGFASGMASGEKSIRKQVKRIARMMVRQFKKELGIKSPSKVFLRQARRIIQGLAIGLKNTKPLRKAQKRVNRATRNLLGASGKKQEKRALKRAKRAMRRYRKRIEALRKKEFAKKNGIDWSAAKDAQGANGTAEDAKKDLDPDAGDAAEKRAEQVVSKITSEFDKLKGAVSLTEILAPSQLRRQMDRNTKYMREALSNRKRLRELGLSEAVLAQIAEMTPQQAARFTQRLINTPGMIEELNESQSAFEESGRALAEGIGVGIIKEEKRLKDLMEKLGKSLSDSLKDYLDIQSPSKMFMYHGRMISAGLAEGIDAGYSQVEASVIGLAEQPVLAGWDSSARSASLRDESLLGSGGGTQITIPVYPSEEMNETELAQKVGREMGWRL